MFLSIQMITQCFPTYLGTITCIIETFNVFFIKYRGLYKNKGSMVAILDFAMAAKDTQLKMCPVHLLTSKMYVYTLKSCFYYI